MKRKILSLLLIALFCINLLPIGNVQAKVISIKDVDEGNDAYQSIQEVLDQGWMSLTLGKFYPDKKVTRAEFAYILTKFKSQLSEVSENNKVSFNDVNNTDKYAKYIELQKNYITYYKTKTGKYFKPKNYLTREDALVSIVKTLGYDTDEATTNGVDSEVDIDEILEDYNKISSSLKDIVSMGVTNELINLYEDGDKMYLYPKQSITRQELAQLLVNAQNSKEYNKTDESKDKSDSKKPLKDNSSEDSSIDDEEVTTSNSIDTSNNNNNFEGIITFQGMQLGYITIKVNNSNRTYYQDLPRDFGDLWSFTLKDDIHNFFILTLPSGLKAGDKLTCDSTNPANNSKDFKAIFNNSAGERFKFGDVSGKDYNTKHLSSKLTLTITSNDIKDGYLIGTIEGELKTLNKEVVTFSKGLLKYRLPKSDF